MAQSPGSVQQNRCSLLGLLDAKHTEKRPESREREGESRPCAETVGQRRSWEQGVEGAGTGGLDAQELGHSN